MAVKSMLHLHLQSRYRLGNRRGGEERREFLHWLFFFFFSLGEGVDMKHSVTHLRVRTVLGQDVPQHFMDWYIIAMRFRAVSSLSSTLPE